MKKRHSEILELLHKEVKPALGCTEPIAVALAVAKAVEVMENKCKCNQKNPKWRLSAEFEIEISVSGNVLKNAMGVGIPGTGMVGLHIASALGAVCGKSSYGLEVLHELCEESIARAKELVSEKRIKIIKAVTEKKLYIKAKVRANESHDATAIIEDDHDKFVAIYCDNDKMFERTASSSEDAAEKSTSDYNLSVKEIYDFAKEVNFEDIEFILNHRKLNYALSKEGLNGNYGLCVGKTIKNNADNLFGKDFMSYAMAITAAASDARMAGCTLPAMSNSGSGNQGITVSLPVIAYAKRYKKNDEELARALTLSNLVAIHIKGYLGKLSALCGCVVASAGSACGIVMLKGGSYDQVCHAIKNMIGNITGMVCDGAKVGCAMKVSSGVSGAVQSAVLAMAGKCIDSTDGIIEDDIEKTIRNLGNLGSKGMQEADKMIQEIMICK